MPMRALHRRPAQLTAAQPRLTLSAIRRRSGALPNRWFMLAVLFTVRLSMAFQFQSVASVAPLLGPKFGVSLADVGLLIGLYFIPGVALALPGGAIGQRLADRATVVLALVSMLIGSLAMALSDPLFAQ